MTFHHPSGDGVPVKEETTDYQQPVKIRYYVLNVGLIKVETGPR